MIKAFLAGMQPRGLNQPIPLGYWLRYFRFWFVIIAAGAIAFAVVRAFPGFGSIWNFLFCAASFISIGYYLLFGSLPAGAKRGQVLAMFSFVLIAAAYWVYRSHLEGVQYLDFWTVTLPAYFAFVVALSVAEGVSRRRGEEMLASAIRAVGETTVGRRDRIGSQLVFAATDGKAAWGIDPATRTLLFASISDGCVHSSVWDEPIRGVALRRVGSEFDSELTVRSGNDSTREWCYRFEITSAHRAIAARWHEILEGWMNEDRQQDTAQALAVPSAVPNA